MPAIPPEPACIGFSLALAFEKPAARHACAAVAMMFLLFVLKMRQALTFLATIGNEFGTMKTLAVISILALLTITGAVYSDQVFVSEQLAQGSN
jgi:hypothetical protein